MKRYWKIWIISMAAVMSFTACQQNEEWKEELEKNALPGEGYFTVSFFADTQHPQTRASITGGSERIQSLLCLIYKKEYDGSYTFKEERTIINYEGTEGNVTPQTYEWPLQQNVTFELPNGDYKAVFVGNINPKLFAEQKSTSGTGLEPILTGYKEGFTSARIHMPQKGPLAFNQYNMFYLCTVDFNQNNPNPDVLLQRIVSNNVYTRNTVDANDAVSTLLNNVVSQIRENQLTTDIIRGVLHISLLEALKADKLLEPILGSLTTVVDHLVNGLLGDIVSMLNEALLQELSKRLEASLDGQAGAGNGLLGLGYLLNPWTTTDNANLIYHSMTESVNFNCEACTAYKADVEWKNVPINTDENNTKYITLTCLNGIEQVSQINVGNNGTYPELLRPILGTLDEKVINGLLVNIHTPLKYSMVSNLQYSTIYELLDLKLRDSSVSDKDTVTISLQLNKITNLEEIVKGLLGDGLISGLIDSLVGTVIDPILNVVLHHTVKFVGIKLPNLGIGNIQLRGMWDATKVSNGTIAPPLTPTE